MLITYYVGKNNQFNECVQRQSAKVKGSKRWIAQVQSFALNWQQYWREDIIHCTSWIGEKRSHVAYCETNLKHGQILVTLLWPVRWKRKEEWSLHYLSGNKWSPHGKALYCNAHVFIHSHARSCFVMFWASQISVSPDCKCSQTVKHIYCRTAMILPGSGKDLPSTECISWFRPRRLCLDWMISLYFSNSRSTGGQSCSLQLPFAFLWCHSSAVLLVGWLWWWKMP